MIIPMLKMQKLRQMKHRKFLLSFGLGLILIIPPNVVSLEKIRLKIPILLELAFYGLPRSYS